MTICYITDQIIPFWCDSQKHPSWIIQKKELITTIGDIEEIRVNCQQSGNINITNSYIDDLAIILI